MSTNLSFVDRVAIVTAAGEEPGRSIALELARRGASVIVNDPKPDEIVKEITKNGGKAFGIVNPVCTTGEQIVQFALQKFGKIDIIINNTFTTKPGDMDSMSVNDWNFNIRINLKSCFRLMKEAWPALRNNKHGRIIFTSGFSEYLGAGSMIDGTTRMAIQGFTQALSKEGDKYDIKVNTVLPVTADRVPQLPNTIRQQADYTKVVPLLVYLASSQNEATGSVFEAGANWVGRWRWQRGPGQFFSHNFTAEDVRDHVQQIRTFNEQSDNPSEMVETMGKVVNFWQSAKL